MQLSGLMREIGLPHDDGWKAVSSWVGGFVGISMVGGAEMAEDMARRLSNRSRRRS